MERILRKKGKEEKLMKKIQRRKERNRRKKRKSVKRKSDKREREGTKRENEKYYVLSCVRNYVDLLIRLKQRVCYVRKFEVMRD